MGGGRSGLFQGTAGADVYQKSLFLEPIDIRYRGATYLPNVGSAIVGGATIGGQSKDKLYFLTIKEILKKFMDYPFGGVSESKLVHWLQTVLSNRHYYIESSLRHIGAVDKVGILGERKARARRKTPCGVIPYNLSFF